MRSHVLMAAFGLAAPLALTAGTALAQLPPVSSGNLVAHFKADNSSVTRDVSDNVSGWSAQNDGLIILSASGSDPSNITYLPTGMNGNPTIRVNDFSGDNQVLRGVLPGTHTTATIFWLGFYSPGRDGSLDDDAGQYAYSYGADAADGSQFDHQIDSGVFQMFGGGGTQTGDNIAARNGQYTVWRTRYGTAAGDGHEAFADGTNLNIASPNGGNYSVGGALQLFGFQNSAGTSDGFNFVGNMSELVIYSGLLNPTDTAAVEAYLTGQIPEPSSLVPLAAAASCLLRPRRRRAA